jgi:hypothetical protein
MKNENVEAKLTMTDFSCRHCFVPTANSITLVFGEGEAKYPLCVKCELEALWGYRLIQGQFRRLVREGKSKEEANAILKGSPGVVF